MDFFGWLEASAIGVWVRESLWGYPFTLTLHAIGMAIVVGTILMFDLRMLGYGKRAIPSTWFDNLFPIAWVGFAVNLISGLVLFAGEPGKFLSSLAFQIKLALIAAGGLTLWFIGKSIRESNSSSSTELVGNIRLTAAVSICFWIGAIVAGRLIAYT